MGLTRAGFDVVAAFDSWSSAIRCYNENFDHKAEMMDLSQSEQCASVINDIDPDIIAGGPPCQDFSHAGKRKEGLRASLTSNFATIVQIVRPAWFIMENVDRAKTSNSYAAARRIFKLAGYGLTERTLNACFCGVPQKRKRFFCIGGLGSRDDILGPILDERLSKTALTVRKYLRSEIDVEYYYRHPRNYSRRGVYSIDEPAPTMRGMNRPVPKGYPGHAADATDVTSELRQLTTYERGRIQTFPKTYRWIGTKTDTEQMIGNAVPVELASFVGRALRDYIETGGNGCSEAKITTTATKEKELLWHQQRA